MAQKKLTRNSYKRKIIIFGIMIFMSVALISTGFAAWVISRNATHTENGNIQVGTIKEANMEFEAITLSAPDFLFEPMADDNSGRVKYDPVDAKSECMSITISGRLTQADYLDKLTIKLVVDSTLADQDPDRLGTTGVKKAAELGYIELPLCATEAVQINAGTLPEGATYNYNAEDKVATFTYTITFKWGDLFGNQNPGLYFDDPSTGASVADEEVSRLMNDFRNTVHDITEGVEGVDPTFRIVLDASLK